MQLFKYLQSQGVGSRKECLQLINSKCIMINGAVCSNPHSNIQPDNVDSLEVNGKLLLTIPMPYFYILLNKPAGYETSHKPQQYPSIFNLLPDHMRRIPMQAVGRLDADTTGALLITNDGNFNHCHTSPKHKVPKEYQVTLKHAANQTLCQALTDGVRLYDSNETVAAADAVLQSPHTLLLTITAGKYHQVKRMVAAAGNRVLHLHRSKFGNYTVEHLETGMWEFIRY